MAHPLALEEICRLIDALLVKGYPTVDAVARLLRLSPRTLQRLLRQQGTSYSELVDCCRCQAACYWLCQTRRPVHEIAAALGYREASSFSRAFRRWTGTAPRAFRYQAQRRKTASWDPVSRVCGSSGRFGAKLPVFSPAGEQHRDNWAGSPMKEENTGNEEKRSRQLHH